MQNVQRYLDDEDKLYSLDVPSPSDSKKSLPHSYALILDLKNLGGINKAFNHEGANILLRHISQSVQNILEKQGINDDNNIQLKHRGGGEFIVILPPWFIKNNGDKPSTMCPLTHQVIDTISAQIHEEVNALNNMAPSDILPSHLLPLKPPKTIAETPSAHVERQQSGLFIEISSLALNYRSNLNKIFSKPEDTSKLEDTPQPNI